MKISTPLTIDDLNKLYAGENVLLSGEIYTARDAAHMKLINLLKENKELPIPLEGQVIYYVGPSPSRENQVIGSAGPTTSYRMDTFTPELLKNGLKGMIGKGGRSREVKEAIRKYKAVYFAAVGGAAALIAQKIKKSEVIAYPELGPEAIRKLEVDNLPLIVINDIYGNDFYQSRQIKTGK